MYNSALKLTDLYDDVLIVILKALPLKDKFKCERVCRRWQRIILDQLKNQTIITSRYANWSCMDAIEHRPAEEFFIDEAMQVPERTHYFLRNIFTKCPNIKSLRIWCRLNIALIASINALCPKLECFSFWSYGDVQISLTIGVLMGARLKHICIYAVIGHKGTYIERIINRTPRLEQIRLEGPGSCPGVCFAEVSPHIRNIFLSKLDLGNTALDDIATGNGQLINDLNVQFQTTRHLQQIGQRFRHLTALRLKRYDFDGVCELHPLGMLTKLQSLTMTLFDCQVSKQDLLMVMRGTPALSKFSVYGGKFPHDWLSEVDTLWPYLATLSLEKTRFYNSNSADNNCFIDQSSISAIAKLHHLRELFLTAIMVNDEICDAIYQCKTLRHVIFDDCPVTTAAIDAVLNLSTCTKQLIQLFIKSKNLNNNLKPILERAERHRNLVIKT